MPSMTTSVETKPVNGRTWKVFPTTAPDGTITHIKMVWGHAERSFKPGEESDTLSIAGFIAAQTLIAKRTAEPQPDNDDDFDLIERFG